MYCRTIFPSRNDPQTHRSFQGAAGSPDAHAHIQVVVLGGLPASCNKDLSPVPCSSRIRLFLSR
jgi:hypothetical protein